MSYDWTDDMREVSGFGGAYELACRRMVSAGLEWLDANPTSASKVEEFYRERHARGWGFRELEDFIPGLVDAIARAAEGPTGAMVGTATHHVVTARKLGWEAYSAQMRQLEAEARARRAESEKPYERKRKP